jgi:hypothetical protein
MSTTIFQIQITLKGLKPKIWRRILITSDTLLFDFHKIIQTIMGWTNSHLHQFIKNGRFYTIIYEYEDFVEDVNNIDYRKKGLKVSDLLSGEKDKIKYEYDFGDGWVHDIILEKVLPHDNNINYPVCVAGKMNCPPEDCGGIWGYSRLLEILKQPKHEEYESYIEWLGDEFDPEHFDKNEVNYLLRTKDYGCIC